jgi:hypothetical protein
MATYVCHAVRTAHALRSTNELNNLPLGYSYGRDSDNSPLLKLIFPNMLKIGRLNSRALDGPVRIQNAIWSWRINEETRLFFVF